VKIKLRDSLVAVAEAEVVNSMQLLRNLGFSVADIERGPQVQGRPLDVLRRRPMNPGLSERMSCSRTGRVRSGLI